MSQSFKRVWMNLVMQPVPCIISVAAIVATLLWWDSILFLPIVGVLLIAMLLQQRLYNYGIGVRVLTDNFCAIPSWGGYLFVVQTNNPLVHTCSERVRSLYKDEKELTGCMPKGRYCTYTHEIIVKRLRRAEKEGKVKILTLKPSYKASMKNILTASMHGKCKSCKEKCKTYKLPARQFFYVKFKVISNTT